MVHANGFLKIEVGFMKSSSESTGSTLLSPYLLTCMAVLSNDPSHNPEEFEYTVDNNGKTVRRWLQQVEGTMVCTRIGLPIGHCIAYLILRSDIPDFRNRMMVDHDSPGIEKALTSLALDVFDRHGRLKNEVKEHPIKKGSGVWGSELDTGDLLFLKEVWISKRYRRRGLGRQLVQAVWKKMQTYSGRLFAIAEMRFVYQEVIQEPRYEGATNEHKHAVHARHNRVIIEFLRSLGFRRVGSLDWFALACDLDHPSYALRAAADFGLPDSTFWKTNALAKSLRQKAQGSSDETFLAILRSRFKTVSADDSKWLRIYTEHGSTILHLAAAECKPKSVAWLISQKPDLLLLRDHMGNTALDGLESRLEDQRSILTESIRVKETMGILQMWDVTRDISDHFQGFPMEAVQCLQILKHLDQVSDEDLLRLKYGCTCGQCLGGFLSPRMRMRLREENHSSMQLVVFSAKLGRTSSQFMHDISDIAKCLPDEVVSIFKEDKQNRHSLVCFFRSFGACLANDQIPNSSNMSPWLSNSAKRLRKDFDPARANALPPLGTCVFQKALNWDRQIFRHSLGADELKKVQKQLAHLPECRNDLEYGFASRMCGYGMVSLPPFEPQPPGLS
ncbi:hypothetical protein P153DRAFT_13423 [Dothidotthia symphoricarpi CBS 119687]|uniref:N-acetyltransferase domain-containing protein n=1 Tax=Dothidotthia symphoricarpi CBS 119687 TaxID=1392245 RepID=A0A6A6AVH5_9PLEO|nr:uncharacterized protein P153DRAFT_13423 [Dothidotthia symphoricarpi CBS 119687]KAF2134955.1 hypothetical protein P153DRAFT_13423 [Dothidotthia symphoricarpi CBS 119687]